MSDPAFTPALKTTVELIMDATPAQLIALGLCLDHCCTEPKYATDPMHLHNRFFALMLGTAGMTLTMCMRKGSNAPLVRLSDLMAGFSTEMFNMANGKFRSEAKVERRMIEVDFPPGAAEGTILSDKPATEAEQRLDPT